MNGKRSRESDNDLEGSLEELLFGPKSTSFTNENDLLDFSVDRKPTDDADINNTVPAVWKDDEDDNIEINLNNTNRLKKLKRFSNNGSKSVVSGAELSELLQQRYQSHTNAWSAIASATESQKEFVDNEENQLAGLEKVPMKDSLKKWKPMANGKIFLRRAMDANSKEKPTASITTINFHPKSDLFLVGSEDKHVNIFTIKDGESEHKIDIKFPETSIRTAKFSNDRNEVYASGRKPFFYSYDIESGVVAKIRNPPGSVTNFLEHMFLSPSGNKIAFLGSRGYVHLADGKSKQWMFDMKMNSSARTGCFLDDNYCITSGFDAEIYLWDLRYNNGKCVTKFANEDGTPTTSLAAYIPNSDYDAFKLPNTYLSVGAASGVVTIYKTTDIINGKFESMKSVMNLTTKVTSAHFHPSGQILATASKEVNGQIKLIHLPSCTVFNNWPQKELPLKKISAIEFNNAGNHLAIANNKGRVLLFDITNRA